MYCKCGFYAEIIHPDAPVAAQLTFKKPDVRKINKKKKGVVNNTLWELNARVVLLLKLYFETVYLRFPSRSSFAKRLYQKIH